MTATLRGFADLLRQRRRPADRLIVQVDASFHEPRYGLRIHQGGVETHREAGELGIPGISSTHAEFYALIEALEQLRAWGMTNRSITIQVDNETVARIANQSTLKGWKWRTLHQMVRALMVAFDDLEITWIPRERNGAHRGAYRHRPQRMSAIVTP